MKILPFDAYLHNAELLEVQLPEILDLPFFQSYVPAGFPSPAEDYLDLGINILDFITDNKTSTFFVKASGDSMEKAHIVDGSLLAVDKSRKPKHNDIVIGIVYNEFTVKRLSIDGNKTFLLPENDKYQPVEITEEMNFRVWGVVVTILNKV